MDDRVPEHRDSHASSSHEPSLEPTPSRSVDLGKHTVYTHFPEDRNCEICHGPKSQWARAEDAMVEPYLVQKNLLILIAADHKVLSEGCESRNNHRCAIVVQDLTTQWIQSYPWKTKTSQETQRSLQKFLEPNRKPEVIYTDNSLEFGKACEDLSWNHCTSTPHRSDMGLLKEQYAKWKKAPLQYCCNQVWMKIGGQILWNVIPICETFKIWRFGEPFKGPIIPFGSLVEYYPISAKDQSRIHQFGKKVLPGLFLGYALYARRLWKGDILVADTEELETMDAS